MVTEFPNLAEVPDVVTTTYLGAADYDILVQALVVIKHAHASY